MQGLTLRDMLRFAQDRLVIGAPTQDMGPLIAKLIDRADGVFLWVAMVVKSMRQSIGQGRDVKWLEKELNILPIELNDLFDHLLYHHEARIANSLPNFRHGLVDGVVHSQVVNIVLFLPQRL